MVEKIYYIENTNALEVALEKLSEKIPCFVTREYVEMNYSKVTIHARIEDLATVETLLALLVQRAFFSAASTIVRATFFVQFVQFAQF